MKKNVFDKNSKKTGENTTKTGKVEGIVKTWSLQAKSGDVTGLIYIYKGTNTKSFYYESDRGAFVVQITHPKFIKTRKYIIY